MFFGLLIRYIHHAFGQFKAIPTHPLRVYMDEMNLKSARTHNAPSYTHTHLFCRGPKKLNRHSNSYTHIIRIYTHIQIHHNRNKKHCRKKQTHTRTRTQNINTINIALFIVHMAKFKFVSSKSSKYGAIDGYKSQ